MAMLLTACSNALTPEGPEANNEQIPSRFTRGEQNAIDYANKVINTVIYSDLMYLEGVDVP